MAWLPDGESFEEAVDAGSDQVGTAYGQMFTNSDLPECRVEVRLYPSIGDINEPDLTDVGVECQIKYVITDASGEVTKWEDVEYREGFDVRSYPSVAEAEEACQRSIRHFSGDRINWNGQPSAA